MMFRNAVKLLFLLPVCLSVFGCKEMDGFNDVVSQDTTKPEKVTNIRVENFNGGAHIIYDLPKSPNLLYVLAKYRINDQVERETKSSYYTDTITVNGFAADTPHEVTLYAVSRANIMSDPVSVTVHPNKPVYQLVAPTITLTSDFGGVNVKAQNTLKREIGLIFVAFDDNTGVMEVQDQLFTREETIDYSVRGYSSSERRFGVYVTDQWGNISDTTIANITPLYEELLDKSKFRVYQLPTDSPIGYNWILPNLWDGRNDGDGWHTVDGVRPPFVCSFDVGNRYKLSRFVMWARAGEYAYGHGNPKVFSLWGSSSAQPRDIQLPLVAEEGAQIGDWINLGNYRFPDPPSGASPRQSNAADEAFLRSGVSFDVPLNAPAVRYLRLSIAETWSGGSSAHVIELSLYGSLNN